MDSSSLARRRQVISQNIKPEVDNSGFFFYNYKIDLGDIMPFTICYDWEDLDASKTDTGPEQKFGDHFSNAKTLEEAFEETRVYVRGTLGRQKHKYDEGRVVIHKMWDVSEYAKRKNRFGPHQKVDDLIRPVIGYHVQADVHRIDADTLITRVNQELIKMDQQLPIAGLAAWQARTAETVIEEIGLGKRTIIAELCARFGKTIWSGALIRETNAQLTIVVSYVLTSFTSFEKDLSSYNQFRNLELVDTADPTYQQKINQALALGKQVVTFLSMCSGTKRQQKIDYLFNLPCVRLVIVDEADFGVHRGKQAKPLINAKKDNDVVILMTGTNADKAASYWSQKDMTMLSVVYPELIMEKNLGQKDYTTTLQHFAIDASRHNLVVDIQFYQMDLINAIEFARQSDPDAFVNNGVYLPSWTKFAAYPVKAKGFWTRVLEAVFLGQHGWDELNVDLQTGRKSKEGQRVAMMFLPGSMKNENLEEAVSLAKQALPGYCVVAIYGDEMTNRSAESQVKEEIEKASKAGQDVLLLSAGMAQRSFSVGAITELYLAYDTGDSGATTQKISRALTPDQQGKIGRIVSLSFDPNRDDKFDALLIETAFNYKRTHNIKSAKDAMRDVIRTVDIFRCTPDGSIKLEVDEYLEQAMERRSVERVGGKTADIFKLDHDQMMALSQGNADAFKAATVAAAEKGKTSLGSKGKSSNGAPTDISDAQLIAKVREVITTIIENMDIVVYGTGTTNLSEAFATIAKDPEKQQAIEQEFGIEFDLIRDLFDLGVINTDFVELQVDL